MKLIKRNLLFVLVLVLLASCGPKATATPVFQGDNPYAPQASDSPMMRGDVTIDTSALSLTKSLPPQVLVNFAYFQPTPCYQVRVEISGSDADNHINIKRHMQWLKRINPAR